MISNYKLVVLVVYYIHEYSYTDAKEKKKKASLCSFSLHPVCVSTRINYCKSLLYTIEHFF